ncbi:MAG TPA: MFS transporter [Gaiellaceae bacterium]|nr:MFS transporter [Gaiellaceae bacterium]
MNLLRLADFRRFWAGQTISLFGDQISLLALPLVAVLVLDAGAADMGYLGAAALAPHLLFSLPAGVWLDRVARRRRIMIAADLLRAALVASIPLAYALDALTFAQLYAVAFLTGSLAVAFDISYTTIFVSVVARADYVEANALLNGSRSLSFVGGPSLAGILVQLVGAPATLVGDAISYLASALFLGRVQAAEPPLEPGHDGSVRTRVAEGMRFIANHPIFRPSLLAVATINLFNFMFFALFVLYATRGLGITPGTLGLVLGAGAVGGILGALVASRIGRRLGIGGAFALGCVLFPAPLVLVPLAEGPEWLVLGMLFAAEFLSGLGVMILDISAGAIIPALTPHRLRSRATGAFRFVNYGVRPVGALIGGALGSAIGLRPTLWIATVGAIAGALWLLPSPVPGLRELPEEAS